MPNRALIVKDKDGESNLRKVAMLEKRLAEIDWELEYVSKSPERPEKGVPIVPMETLWDPKDE